MSKRLLVAALVTGLAWSMPLQQVHAAVPEGGYAGMEFFGSSQVTRGELEKDAAIKPGAGVEAVRKGAERLRLKLSKRHLDSAIAVVPGDNGNIYLTVDVMDNSGLGIPVRKMVSPHRVPVSNELVFSIRSDISKRLMQLVEADRPVSTSISEEGTLLFTDEPCNQLGKKLLRLVPPMRAQLFDLIGNDPDPMRRGEAVVLLNWDTKPVQNSRELAPAVDDASSHVRLMADQFLIPRLELLPDNFPIQELIEVFSHQLSRPSHSDRLEALRALLAIVHSRPYTAGTLKAANEERLKELESQSVLSAIKLPAAELLEAFRHVPEPPKLRNHHQLNEF